jgi:hypothetical protein
LPMSQANVFSYSVSRRPYLVQRTWKLNAL